MGLIAHLAFLSVLLPFVKDSTHTTTPYIVKEYEQMPLMIERGQYSGISWIAADKYSDSNLYVAVDDKLNGGGIVFFNIPIDRKTGEVGNISITVAEGTLNSEVKAKDNEGVAYFPSTETIFVSAEGDQTIAEYYMNGSPTGVTLYVPEDLKQDKLRFKNGGFESLTYNHKTGLFWTTPERHLLKDSLNTSARHLQSFSDITFFPVERFMYHMDEPSIEIPDSGKYAFGISDLCALDDGKIIVMEREVYAPKVKGNEGVFKLFEIASKTFCKVKLYVVDPVKEKEEVLTKRLLLEIETSGIFIANYEGITLGPQLADGSRVLLLIADSQANSLTTEWLKVLIIK